MAIPKHPLRVNVGFIAHQPVGSSRNFRFEYASLRLQPDLDAHDLSASAELSRTHQGILAQVNLEATTPTECTRCLNVFEQPLRTSFTELFAFSPQSASESDLLFPEDGNIDFAPLAREYLILEIPINPLCLPDCKGLCPVCGENLNQQACYHEVDDVDPRMAKLKSLRPD